MGDVNQTRADKLAAAKKLLKDFETKKDRSSPASVVYSEPGNNRRDNSIISDESSQGRENNLSVNALTNGSSPSPYLNGSELEWYNAYQQLKRQHDELTNHYSQLHSAYSQVSANGVHVDTENQISQLQAALSTLVEEKLQCQSELRKVNDEFAKFKLHISNRPLASSEVPKDDVDVKNLKDQIQEKDKLLEARQFELESVRRESSNIQASLLNVQHERSEAQARVRSLAKDIGAHEATVQQLKKDLQLKDLYLKQLGAHNVLSTPTDEIDLKTLHEQVEKLTADNAILREEKQRTIIEASNMREHYLERENALQQRQKELVAQLDEVQTLRWSAEANLQQLQNEAAVLVKTTHEVQETPLPTVSESEITEEDVARRVRDAVRVERENWQRREEAIQKERDEEIQNKDRTIFEREQSLAELEMKYRLLEEQTLVASESGADLLNLSEQLQNEKATVSRAVSQNRELKQSLIEAEDRVVRLTEEKLVLELAKQAAEHQLKELNKISGSEAVSREDIGMSLASSHSVEPATVSETDPSKTDDREVEAQRELEEIRSQLNEALAELSQVRAELRRSNTQNEQMDQIMRQNAEDENQNSIHVELTQAVARISQLAAENDQLRDELNETRELLERERERVVEPVKLVESTNLATPIEVSFGTPNELEWAHKELEKRFARAMVQNAELTENVDKLEHINQQLQLENDTIADHVVLYHHQRRLIRERLKAKDDQLKSLETERIQTVARCQELQQALMAVLNKGGMLKEYEKVPRGKKVRSYSHSTVDEMSGDEDVVVDASKDLVPLREENGNGRPATPPNVRERSESPDSVGSIEQEATVKRILEIITDISKPRVLPAAHLQCTQCIGEVQDL